MHDYLHDKVHHDTGDAYSVHSQESGAGKVDLKLRRVSAKFDTCRIQGK